MLSLHSRLCILAVSLTLMAGAVAGREIHVAVTGDDHGPGTAARPFRTIGRGAAEAQPGDQVIVHGGTYREWVKPPRGGTSEERRITYRAGAGEQVFVKGSERIVDWQAQGGGVWRARTAERLLRDLQPVRVAALRWLVELRPVAPPRGRLPQRRGVPRTADARGRCHHPAELALPCRGRPDDDPRQLSATPTRIASWPRSTCAR